MSDTANPRTWEVLRNWVLLSLHHGVLPLTNEYYWLNNIWTAAHSPKQLSACKHLQITNLIQTTSKCSPVASNRMQNHRRIIYWCKGITEWCGSSICARFLIMLWIRSTVTQLYKWQHTSHNYHQLQLTKIMQGKKVQALKPLK